MRLLKTGESYSEISRLTGVSQSYVKQADDAKLADTFNTRRTSISPPIRCPGCGGSLQELPCLLCQLSKS
jgi:hypothetical protein